MNYLSPPEYEQYGIETSTPEPWVGAASALMDAHCRRTTLMAQQYSERIRIAAGRNTVLLTFLPLVAVSPASSPLTLVRARYANPRRGEAPMPGVIEAAWAFFLLGTWAGIAAADCDFDPATGEVTLPMNIFGLGYNEAEFTYTAGVIAPPDELKFACAQIVKNAQATPALNVKAGTVERMKLQYFSDSLLDSSVRKLLAPYVAQRMH